MFIYVLVSGHFQHDCRFHIWSTLILAWLCFGLFSSTFISQNVCHLTESKYFEIRLPHSISKSSRAPIYSWFYAIMVYFTCIPQIAVNGSILLLICPVGFTGLWLTVEYSSWKKKSGGKLTSQRIKQWVMPLTLSVLPNVHIILKSFFKLFKIKSFHIFKCIAWCGSLIELCKMWLMAVLDVNCCILKLLRVNKTEKAALTIMATLILNIL